MLWVFFHRHSSDKIYSLKLYHLLNVTLHSKANACNIGTLIKFYMQMQVEKTKAFAKDSIGHSHNSVYFLSKCETYNVQYSANQ